MTEREVKLQQLVALTARKAELEEMIRQLRDELLEDATVGDRLQVDGRDFATVQVAGRRFDQKRAAEVLDTATYSKLTRPQIDQTLAKKTLPPDVYEQCMTEGRPSLRLVS